MKAGRTADAYPLYPLDWWDKRVVSSIKASEMLGLDPIKMSSAILTANTGVLVAVLELLDACTKLCYTRYASTQPVKKNVT